jgi:hypothetical protein
MTKLYGVWYAKKFDPFCEAKVVPGSEELEKTHAFVNCVIADDLDEAFMKMQAEVWSPNGEAREQIKRAGTDHTSMSVGDLIEEQNGIVHRCEMVGWQRIV